MNDVTKPVPAPPVDPNLRQNRVPSRTELITLRNIRSHKRQMADITKRQFEATLEEHRHIQVRHDQLLRDLEAAQSELNISHSYLEDLKNQLDLFQIEDDRLTGLLHPIRRCPQDILILIFEWTLEIDSRHTLEIANSLSQVCEFWRTAALSTARLWSHLDISMQDEISALNSFMERTKSRLRNYPPHIDLHDIKVGNMENLEEIMDQVKLRSFKSIGSLKYHLTDTKDLVALTYPSLRFSPASVEHVGVKVPFVSEDPTDWDCELLLNQSPGISFLELEVRTTIIFGGDQVYPALLKLSIKDSLAPSLLLQLSKFPGIQELRITGKEFTMHAPSEDIVLPQLQVLHIQGVVGFAWSKMSAPRLRELESDNLDDDHRSLAFCVRHLSVTKFTYAEWIEEDQLKTLANSMPNLEYLDTGGDFRGMYLNLVPEMPFPPFPKLKTLVVDDTGDHRLSLVEFETFVSTRLLPFQSQEIPKLKVWKIIAKADEMDILPWYKSDLLSRLHETFEVCAFDDSKHYVSLVPK